LDWVAGPDFERSLTNLQTQLASVRKRMSSVQEVTLPLTHVLSVRSATATSAIGAALATSFARITRYAMERSLPIVGAPFVSYPGWNGRTTAMIAMLPIATSDTGQGDVTGSTRPPMRAVALDYYGPYELIGLARDALEQYLAARDIPVGESWEEYLTDPATAPDPATWHTRVYYAVR
jgi:effector-binding domain-containing protein